MATLARRWAGHLYGTNTGNLFADFEAKHDGSVAGTVRVMDNVFGLTVFKGVGTFTDRLRLKAEPMQVPQGVQAGTLDVDAVLTPEGNLRGEWKSSIGTAGTFVAYPHEIPETGDSRQTGGLVPEQLYISTAKLGALRLSAVDVHRLIEFIRKDFVVGRAVVTYRLRQNEVSKYADEFERELPTLGDLRYLKVTVQEHEAHGINRAVFVELDSEGTNEIRTQGIQESWVVGKAEAVARLLKDSEKTLVTTYKKFGLGLNQIIFFATLVLVPEIDSLQYRAAFVAVVMATIAGLYAIHQKFIPNTVVYGTTAEPSVIRKALPSVASWLAGVVASVVAALVFWWLTGKS